MDTYSNDNIEKFKRINLLINDIFELSCSYTKSHCVVIKSCDKLERDIFSLDCARFQLEMILINSGLSVEKFYDYKYIATSPNDDEYRSFAYSFNAFVTLWKNFCYSNSAIMNIEPDIQFINKSIDALITNLEKTKRILMKNYIEIDYNSTFSTDILSLL
ncbi:MAG: hypothetical protein E7213_00180 [Clostridium sp.]|nr:hypothetical protein [Clostridium sp.]